ncbi:arginine repressor [Clostridia bacterium]|nr:arginine repressor [Clostridia bacterium]
MKNRRHKEILEIITQYDIGTQTELANLLRKRDFQITQATVSRDIKELGLIKSNDAHGNHKYVLPMESSSVRKLNRLERVILETVMEVDSTENLVLIKTLPGSANLLASLLDNSDWIEMMGTIAGDDTVLIILKNKADAPLVCGRIQKKMG